MNQFSIKTTPMLSPRSYSAYESFTPIGMLTPRSSQYETESNCSQIMVKTSHLAQLLNQFDRDLVNSHNLIESLKKGSTNLKNETENKLAKQFANLNRIKQDNERILKTRIQYLEEKLSKVPGFQRENVNADLVNNKSLNRQIAQKNKEITELCLKIVNLENQVMALRLSKKALEQEKLSLIIKQEPVIHYHKQQKPALTKPRIHQSIQTQQFLVKKNLCIKNQTVNALFLGFSSEENKNQLQVKVQNLEKDLEVLQSSNSALRKQLIQLHVYMEEQDEKYQKTIEKLQQKVQKLTSFNARPRSSSNINSKSTLYTQSQRQNSDLRASRAYSRRQSKQDLIKSSIIKLADFNIKLEFEKNSLDETSDNKFTLASSRIE